MRQLKVPFKKMKEWFPETYNTCIQDLRNSKSAYSRFSENKIKWVIMYGFFIPKPKSPKEHLFQNSEYDRKLKLPFEERCKLELKNLRISYVMSAGFYTKSDRCLEKKIPDNIKEMVCDVLKITMIKEQFIVSDETVMESLEKFNNFEQLADVAYYELNEYVDLDNVEPVQKNQITKELNIDDILDKMNKHGKDSLTEIELNFLKNQGK
jgi:hypothetical protein